MKYIETHTIFKFSANLVITATILCVLFGNGVHVHAMFDHMLDHGDVHAFVHSHSTDHTSHHSHAEEVKDNDAHRHVIAKVDLTATLIQKLSGNDSVNPEFSTLISPLPAFTTSKLLIPFYLDLPPPEHLFQSDYFSSYTLRGPPLG